MGCCNEIDKSNTLLYVTEVVPKIPENIVTSQKDIKEKYTKPILTKLKTNQLLNHYITIK